MKILKRDVLGRVTVTREQREALLDEFERGGLKGKPFARLVGVSYPTFASWIQQRRHARGDYARMAALSPKPPAAKLLPAPRAVRLMEALVSAAPTPEPAAVAPGIEVLLPGGAKVLVADARQAALAAQLINALRSSSC